MPLELARDRLTCSGVLLLDGLGEGLSVAAQAGPGGVIRVCHEQPQSSFRSLLGNPCALERFVACHRDEPFWMQPLVGSSLSELPMETQFLLARLQEGRWCLLVPLIDEPLRFSLLGTRAGQLELMAETGDSKLLAQSGNALYVTVLDDPFELVQSAAAAFRELGLSQRLSREKPVPDFVDQFGWCTWDACYLDVSTQLVRQGLESFQRGGVQPKFMILDDGWLDVRQAAMGEQRLASFDANHKIEGGLGALVHCAKQEFAIETFLVWHTMLGYWGGVERQLGYSVVDQPRRFGEGILSHRPDFNQQWWGEWVGFVPVECIQQFFEDFHARLRQQGVDGVKVDSQAVLEALAEAQGGRVRVSREYRQALEASVERHFDGRLLNCMAHAQETWYGSPRSNLSRSSIDYFPNQPASHGRHLHTNALVGLWFGQFMQPDWDMFQSGHELGAFHAAARAISGGPVYVSDKPGQHDFDILSRLVCSNGRVLRADQPGVLTLDCLLSDPVREPVLLKVWNRNGPAAIVGAFHCYGDDAEQAASLQGKVGPLDVPGLVGARFVVFRHQANTLELVAPAAYLALELSPRAFELFTLVPLVDGTAAIGLVDKFNSRAAVTGEQREAGCWRVSVCDAGHFAAYSSRAPRSVCVDERPSKFAYESASGRLSVELVGAGPHTLVIER